MCDVVVPPCFPLCYIGTLCGLANSPICQHPLCCYSPPQSIDRAHFGDARLRWRVFWRFPSETPCCLFVYVDRRSTLCFYVDRRSTDYFFDYADRRSTDYFCDYADRRSTDYFFDYADRRSTEYC